MDTEINNEYGNGLLKSIEQMIWWVEYEIGKIKEQPEQQGLPSFRRIT